ncbi:MAG: serine/threonine-protein kinase [Gemmataceae bacterium]
MPTDPGRVKELFLASTALPAADRAAFLAEQCGGDAGLRAAVGRLLAAHDAPDGRVALSGVGPSDPAATGTFAPADPDPDPARTVTHHPTDAPGQVLAGRYKLAEPIGEGGMGTVWMAQQVEPVKRAVAVKLIKAGMDSRLVLARFEAERQALALMDHPNIAKVLDAGLTADGRPFFVMELVKGVPITQFCDARRLSPRERLELFVPVCQAMQHAHQKGVIHRDIKPSNVLVALYDDRPIPKVIDFGVAKAAGQPLTDKTLMTGFGAVVGTPEYMSPEQASFNQLDVDTRSDVYSLGVLLYELLTGSPPHPRKELEKAGLLEILRVIREQAPPRPSARLSTSQTLASIAAVRGTEPARLTRLVRGELDWLVMKALEKDRARRYETANGLAAEVQRFLAGEPVQAVPPSASYRVRKFVSRHRAGVFTAVTFAVLLLAGAAVSSWQAVVATRAEREASTQRDRASEAERQAVAERDAAARAERLATARADDLAYRLGVNEFVLAAAAYDKGDAALAAEHLSNVPPRQRNWEWHFLKHQALGGMFSLYGHRDEVRGVVYSPDGTRILTGSRDGTARLWDARTGTPVLELRGHTGFLSGVAFSPDGARVVTGSEDRTSKVWDARTGTLLLDVRGHTAGVLCVAFSPDGTRLLTGSQDQTARVWDARTGAPVLELKGHTGGVSGVAFSPDGGRAATCGRDGKVRVSDSRTGNVLIEPRGHGNAVHGVSFSPDGARLVTAGEDSTGKIWDARTGALLMDLRCDDVVHSVSFSPDGTRVVTGGYGPATVWDARTGAALVALKGPDHAECVSFSPDGTRVVTGHQDGTATVWDAQSGWPPTEMKGEMEWVHGVVFSPDGSRVAAAGGDPAKPGDVRVWDARTGASILDLRGKLTCGVRCVAFGPDGSRLVTGGGEGQKSGEVNLPTSC